MMETIENQTAFTFSRGQSLSASTDCCHEKMLIQAARFSSFSEREAGNCIWSQIIEGNTMCIMYKHAKFEFWNTSLYHLIYTVKYYITIIVLNCSIAPIFAFPSLRFCLSHPLLCTWKCLPRGQQTSFPPPLMSGSALSHFDQTNMSGDDIHHGQEARRAVTSPPHLPSASALHRAT